MTFLLIHLLGPSKDFVDRHLSDPRSLQTDFSTNINRIHGNIGRGGCSLAKVDVIKTFRQQSEKDMTSVRAILRIDEKFL
mmetsp:Transcript_35084/g.81137  ORF Transcript_35084/g.81137 Transcript_35084/m.81137 type:complete len:80 (+) Transcript_35084:94-333(+)